ncbi:MAG: carbohydrate-binding domain-containing protein [Bacteroides sp.]|nr:carbohydrate-binding domain-containing protein [Bacteroides sp.]
MLILSMVCSGCGSNDNTKQGTVSAEILSGNSVSGQGNTAGQNAMSGEVTLLDITDQFSDRDWEVGYDDTDCVKIVLRQDTASVESADGRSVSDMVAVSGNVVTITASGDYLISGSLQGRLVIEAAKTDKIHLILDGAEISCASSAALYVNQADKVFVTTAPNSENLLETTGEYVAIDEHNIDGAVHSREDITFNGEGMLKVRSAAGNGIVCKDDLVITGGAYEITAGKHGLEGKDSVRIAGGSLTISAAQDGIHSGNDEDETVGYTYIAGGSLTIAAGDDGIHSDTELVIAGGSIRVTESYEGLEGRKVEVAGGEITVYAEDDGINAADGNDENAGPEMFGQDPFAANENNVVILSGGSVTVDAGGDGLDSNGNFYMRGGVLVIYGPTGGGNGALDYNGEGLISGGTVVALGSAQMAQNFGQGSEYCSMLVSVPGMQAAGTTVELKDESGEVLLSCVAQKSYNSAVLSCAEIQVGNTYTVQMGDESVQVEMTDTIYGDGMGFGGGRGFGGGESGFGGRGFGGGGRPDSENGQGFGERPDAGNRLEFEEGQGFGEWPERPEFEDGQGFGGRPGGPEFEEGQGFGEWPERPEFEDGQGFGEWPDRPEGRCSLAISRRTLRITMMMCCSGRTGTIRILT